ncbi:MAG: hypothetical protein HC859_01105 [Bacteroidia bacterium]|nr:hypothetical protein [Bacteroidia bacterium]
MVVKGPGVKDSLYGEHLDYFRHTVSQHSSLDGMSVTSTIPGLDLHWGRAFNRTDDPNNTVGLYIIAVDEFYFEVMGAAFAAGRNFPDGSTAYKDAVILNETAARQLGYQSPDEAVGTTITWHENENTHIPRTVIGVVKDFNQQSLKVTVEPIIFALKKYLFAPWAGEYYAFRLKPGSTRSAVADVQATWNQVFAGNPFDYFFLENYYDAQYSSDNRFSNVFELFAALAIFVACIGLFGLSTYMAIRRTKEIGIRKVLGSSILGIMVLLSRDS